jgi:hypothetical protein
MTPTNPTEINFDNMPDGRPFVWGPIVDIHQISVYTIVEFKRNIDNDETKHFFHVYVGEYDANRDYETLDHALVAAVAYKHELAAGGQSHAANSQASHFFMKMIS